MPHGHCGDGAAFGLQWVICPLNHAMIVAEGPYRFRATVCISIVLFFSYKKEYYNMSYKGSSKETLTGNTGHVPMVPGH